MMKIKDQVICCMLSAGLLAAIAYSGKYLFGQEMLAWHIRQRDYQLMIGEVTLLGLILYGAMLKLKNKRTLYGIILLLLIGFSWGHMVFLPLVISGLYLLYLGISGAIIKKYIFNISVPNDLISNLLLGMISFILFVCTLSAFGIGSILVSRWFIAGTMFPAIFWAYLQTKHNFFAGCLKKEDNKVFGKKKAVVSGILTTIIMVLLLQIGRLNLAIDFDSLWYGLRSPYILDSGKGIYENLGTIGIVYTYSKGLEILTLPLSALPSFSFVLSFNIWIVILVIYTSYQIACKYMNTKYALLLAGMIAVIPGIVNMGITAKSDILTLWSQLIMFFYLLCYIEKQEYGSLVFSFGALLFSWTLKPTAIVFSSVIFCMSICYIIANRLWVKGLQLKEMILAGVFTLSLLAVWARTYLLTGVPVTSVYTSILTKLGFHLRYPYQINMIPSHGIDLTVKEQIGGVLKRLIGFFLVPIGEDMSHVILAWGSISILFFLFIWCLSKPWKYWQQSKSADNSMIRYTLVVIVPFYVVNFISLIRLEQVDGNYFMLFYFFITLLGCITLSEMQSYGWQKHIRFLLIPMTAFNLIIISLTSWSWTTSFTPIKWKHQGYYHHQDQVKEDIQHQGNVQIWNILASDPRKRAIIVGRHPEMLLFPCNTQSYEDITGSWGNVTLVKTMDRFIEFLDYAKTDYIYMQAGYMQENTRCYELMRYLIENETLTDLYYEGGNVLAKVDLNGVPSEEGLEHLIVFDEHYQLGQSQGDKL